MRSPNMRPMHSTDIAPDAFAPYAPNAFNRYAPVCVEGRCPIFDILPLQGANVIKPSRGGDPGCRSLRSLYPGLRYHCPYRAPRPQNLRIITGC